MFLLAFYTITLSTDDDPVTLTISTDSTGTPTITAESDNEDVATCELVSGSFQIKPGSVEGTAVITLKVAETTYQKGAETTITVKVQNNFTVSFDMLGHGTEVDPKVVAKDGLLTEPTAPSETGYVFAGWFTEENFNHRWDFSTETVTKDLTLYAQWVQGTIETPDVPENVTIDQTGLQQLMEAYRGCASKVKYQMNVSDDDVSEQDKNTIKEAYPGKKFVFYNASLMFTEENDPAIDYGSYNNFLISITYPFDFTDKENVEILRLHGTSIDELKETPNEAGEYVTFDEDAGTITVSAKKYSTYGFAYDEVPPTGDTSAAWLYVVLGMISLAGVVLAGKRFVK